MSLFASLAYILLPGILVHSQATSPQGAYRLEPEDVISITVLRHPEFTSEYIIPPNGTLDMPFGGTVKVTGHTVSDLAVELTTMLKKRLLKPEVSVSLKSLRIRRFYVVGDVKLSGVYDLKPNWGVAESLSMAGGLLPDIQQKDVQVTLEHVATGQKLTLPLDEALRKSTDPDLKIQTGDVLRLESIATFPIYVTGKVKLPGMYRMRIDSTDLMAAIAQAGGAADDASIRRVRVIHVDGAEEVADLVPALRNGDSTKLPKLRSGDMIVVPELTEKFAVLGYVTKPGPFAIPNGETYHLADAVALAGGTVERGRIARIALLRLVNGKEDKRVYDLGKFIHKGDASQNPVLLPGDVIYVPETNKVDIKTILTGLQTAAITYFYTK